MNYYKRTADALLKDLLDAFGAVLIEGPKWCGKTTTASQLANSILRMQDPSMRDEYLVTAKTKPSIPCKVCFRIYRDFVPLYKYHRGIRFSFYILRK